MSKYIESGGDVVGQLDAMAAEVHRHTASRSRGWRNAEAAFEATEAGRRLVERRKLDEETAARIDRLRAVPDTDDVDDDRPAWRRRMDKIARERGGGDAA